MKNKIKFVAIVIISLFFIGLFLHYYFNKPLNNSLFIDPICNLKSSESKIVALTFDDGPSRDRTPALLNVLKKHNVKATFFMNGVKMEKNFDVAQRLVDEGHLAANHSYNHIRLLLKSPNTIKAQILKTDSLLNLTGTKDLRYFRPPYADKLIILPWMLKKMKKELINFNVESKNEYNNSFNVDKVVEDVVANCKPGSIILLHDGWNRDSLLFAEAIDKIIISLKLKGYQFVRIDGNI